MKRWDELRTKRRCSMAEETELAFVIARITASEAAFHRSPEGQIHRRIEDLQARRRAAIAEHNRSVGLTRAEGQGARRIAREVSSEKAAFGGLGLP